MVLFENKSSRVVIEVDGYILVMISILNLNYSMNYHLYILKTGACIVQKR